jgi:hypothetical protein
VPVSLPQFVPSLSHHVVDLIRQLTKVLQLLLQLNATWLSTVLAHVVRMLAAVTNQLFGLFQLGFDALL